MSGYGPPANRVEQLERIHEWAAWVVFTASDGHASLRQASRTEYLARYERGVARCVGVNEADISPADYFEFKGMWLHPESCTHPDIQQDVEWDALPTNGKKRQAGREAYWAKWEKAS